MIPAQAGVQGHKHVKVLGRIGRHRNKDWEGAAVEVGGKAGELGSRGKKVSIKGENDQMCHMLLNDQRYDWEVVTGFNNLALVVTLTWEVLLLGCRQKSDQNGFQREQEEMNQGKQEQTTLLMQREVGNWGRNWQRKWSQKKVLFFSRRK